MATLRLTPIALLLSTLLVSSCIFDDDDPGPGGGPGGGPPAGGPPGGGPTATPPPAPPPIRSRRFQGHLGCRDVGRSPKWLEMELPIALEPCSLNLQIAAPHVSWNSRAAVGPDAHDAGLGPGWNLDFDHYLDRIGDEVIVSGPDLTRTHFSLHVDADGEAWVPEPYFHGTLDHDAATGVWTLIDVAENQRWEFQEMAGRGRLVRAIDRHGFVDYFDRAPSGQLLYVTDSALDPRPEPRPDPVTAPPPAWHYALTWTAGPPGGGSMRRLELRDASDKRYEYHVGSGGDLVRVVAPGAYEYRFEYAGHLVTAFQVPGADPIRYTFGSGGHFQSLVGADGRTTYAASLTAAGDQLAFLLEDDRGVKWRAGLSPLVAATATSPARGLYLATEVSDRVVHRSRNEEGYLQVIMDGQSRTIVFEPDDAVRSGTETVVRLPLNDGSGRMYTQRIRWGDYYNPLVVQRTPGSTTHFFYEGIHNDGEEGDPMRCDGHGGLGEPWAFRRLCKRIIDTESPDGDLRESLSIRYETTSHALCGGAGECRLTFVQSDRAPLSSVGQAVDGLGRHLGTLRADGTSVAVIERDARGHVTRTRDQHGVETVLELDPMGRMLSRTLRSPTGARWTWRPEYAPAGYTVASHYEYEGGGRTIRERVVDSEHDASGVPALQRAEVEIDGVVEWGETRYERDELNRITQVITDMPDFELGRPTAPDHRPYYRSGVRTFVD